MLYHVDVIVLGLVEVLMNAVHDEVVVPHSHQPAVNVLY